MLYMNRVLRISSTCCTAATASKASYSTLGVLPPSLPRYTVATSLRLTLLRRTLFHQGPQGPTTPIAAGVPIDAPAAWKAEEDLALQIAVQKHGPNWARVSQVLPLKTPLQCKNRWKHLLQNWRTDTAEDKERKLQGSMRLVGMAMASNFTICLAKLGAALHSGSSSLMSESIHSFMDMINQCLLLIGIRRSLREPSLTHPYGFHREQYAWAIISAVGILFIGGGVPILSGAAAVMNPAETITADQLYIAYGVLGFALACEGFTATRAFLQVRKYADRAGVSFVDYVKSGSDPSSVQVLLEDSSSVIGSLIAGTSLTLTYYLDNPVIDGSGSIAIGFLLSSVAVFLIRRNMMMVLERSMPSDRLRLVTRLIASDPVISSIQDIKSSAIGPEHARFKAEVSFDNRELTRRYLQLKEIDLQLDLDTIKKYQSPAQLQSYLVSFGGGVVEQLGDEIDRIEDNIRDIAPEVKHVDLEVL